MTELTALKPEADEVYRKMSHGSKGSQTSIRVKHDGTMVLVDWGGDLIYLYPDQLPHLAEALGIALKQQKENPK